MLKLTVSLRQFFSVVFDAQNNHLIEMFLLSTHKLCVDLEIRALIFVTHS